MRCKTIAITCYNAGANFVIVLAVMAQVHLVQAEFFSVRARQGEGFIHERKRARHVRAVSSRPSWASLDGLKGLGDLRNDLGR